MNADLEQTLEELGPGYGNVVSRLRSGREIDVTARPVRTRAVAWRIAASFLVLVGLVAVFAPRTFRSAAPAVANYGAREYRLSPDELIARQNPDGSWQNDFLTKRNAEALRACTDAASRIAYKKAMRNLRLRGVL